MGVPDNRVGKMQGTFKKSKNALFYLIVLIFYLILHPPSHSLHEAACTVLKLNKVDQILFWQVGTSCGVESVYIFNLEHFIPLETGFIFIMEKTHLKAKLQILGCIQNGMQN